MKRCPRCGVEFSSGAFCDQDGARLVEVAPSARRGRWRWCLLAVAAVLLAAAVAAPALVQRYVRVTTDVLLDDVLLPGGRSLLRPPEDGDLFSSLVEGAVGVVRAASGRGALLLRLRARNGTLVSGSLVAARYSVHLGGSEIGRGEWSAGEPVLFRAGEETALELALRPDSLEVLDSVLGTAIGREPSLRVHGRVTVEIGLFGRVEVPFEVRRVTVDLTS